MRNPTSPFHEGELAVQRRSGVSEEAAEVGSIIDASISGGAARFLAGQRLAVAASLDAQGQPWASLLTGPAGFLKVVDERLLQVRASSHLDEILTANLAARPELALVVLDPGTRRRMRLNGRGVLQDDGLFLTTQQVYGNCPKYIQKRRLLPDGPEPPGAPVRSEELAARQQDWIAKADTLFAASFHPKGGADASHRGGNPGFVSVIDERHLSFPDYVGNNMFNTLGNLSGYPRAGLLFLDFESGDVLQLAGRATIAWQPERTLKFEIGKVVETRAGSSLRWEIAEYSPTNP